MLRTIVAPKNALSRKPRFEQVILLSHTLTRFHPFFVTSLSKLAIESQKCLLASRRAHSAPEHFEKAVKMAYHYSHCKIFRCIRQSIVYTLYFTKEGLTSKEKTKSNIKELLKASSSSHFCWHFSDIPSWSSKIIFSVTMCLRSSSKNHPFFSALVHLHMSNGVQHVRLWYLWSNLKATRDMLARRTYC